MLSAVAVPTPMRLETDLTWCMCPGVGGLLVSDASAACIDIPATCETRDLSGRMESACCSATRTCVNNNGDDTGSGLKCQLTGISCDEDGRMICLTR